MEFLLEKPYQANMHEKRENDCFSPSQPQNLKVVFVTYPFMQIFIHPHKIKLKKSHFASTQKFLKYSRHIYCKVIPSLIYKRKCYVSDRPRLCLIIDTIKFRF